MSSIVSRRPSSRNHWNEAFWMSMRLGRSRTCLRREKLVRALGAATLVVKDAASLRDAVRSRTASGQTWTAGTTAQPARVPKNPASAQGYPGGFRRSSSASVAEALEKCQGRPEAPWPSGYGDAWGVGAAVVPG